MARRDPVNVAMHEKIRATLDALCEESGWALTSYGMGDWGTGERHELVRAELRERVASGDIALLSLTLPRKRDAEPHLELLFEAAAWRDLTQTEELLAAFVRDLERRHPELGGPHQWTLQPAGVHDLDGLRQNLRDLQGFFFGVPWTWRCLHRSDLIEIESGWGCGHVHALIVRDECCPEDELEAAEIVTRELDRAHPELAAFVTIRGEYCK